MPTWRSIPCAVAFLASQACATLPKISMTTHCGAGWQPAVRIQSIDKRGASLPYVPVWVRSDDRPIYHTWTSSLGEARFALQPGSYRVSVGEEGQWRYAIQSFKIQPDCQVEMQARLIPHEIFPLDGPVVRRTR